MACYDLAKNSYNLPPLSYIASNPHAERRPILKKLVLLGAKHYLNIVLRGDFDLRSDLGDSWHTSQAERQN
jgi:hypothetical protein